VSKKKIKRVSCHIINHKKAILLDVETESEYTVLMFTRDGGHEQQISNGGGFKPAFAERDK
jgi:hypothetical protein